MEQRYVCRACRQLLRSGSSVRSRHPPPPKSFSQLRKSSSKPPTQVNPVGGFYEALMSQPLPRKVIIIPPDGPLPLPSTAFATSTVSGSTAAKAGMVFGSHSGDLRERRAAAQSKSTLIAGVWVPPKPEEPSNCCMSGCVNCVWDAYRDEVEEWAAKRKEADVAMKKEKAFERQRGKRRAGGAGKVLDFAGENEAMSMDDDGAGSESNWDLGMDADKRGDDDDVFKGIPIGIREFMKQEKRLKEKHLREGA